MNPLVSVICVCYNHARFVVEALDSVKNQTYSNIELIIIDDGSQDESSIIIHEWLNHNPQAEFIDLKDNIGYTKAFNKAYSLAKGEFYIDLAADDVLLPDRVEKGVAGFLNKGARYAIQFSDANFIDIVGRQIGKHSDRFHHQTVKQDDVYAEIIHRYFICSPTMMVRKSVLDALGGYDESLEYEDFDLWVRIGRDHLFFYLPEALINRRIVPGSMSHNQYTHKSKQLQSTYLVCEKILRLNRTREEKKALNRRILYEMKWNLRLLNLELVFRYIRLWIRNW